VKVAPRPAATTRRSVITVPSRLGQNDRVSAEQYLHKLADCRHAAATTWLRAGVPLGEVARRLGHSVQTLVSTYVGALDGDEALGNARIDAVLDIG
jgi:integrase